MRVRKGVQLAETISRSNARNHHSSVYQCRFEAGRRVVTHLLQQLLPRLDVVCRHREATLLRNLVAV